MKSTKGGASTTDSTLKLMKYTTDCVDTKDSIKKIGYVDMADFLIKMEDYLSVSGKMIREMASESNSIKTDRSNIKETG